MILAYCGSNLTSTLSMEIKFKMALYSRIIECNTFTIPLGIIRNLVILNLPLWKLKEITLLMFT